MAVRPPSVALTVKLNVPALVGFPVMTVPDPDCGGHGQAGREAARGQREGDCGASGAGLAHRDGRGVVVGRGGDSWGQHANVPSIVPSLAAAVHTWRMLGGL